MREKDFDVKAFPNLHPTSKYGLHHQRDLKLSPAYYFTQRLLNHDHRFSTNIPYIFMAANYLERHTLENQINVSAQRGTFNKNDIFQLKDPFSVFAKLSGSPKYWKQVPFKVNFLLIIRCG